MQKEKYNANSNQWRFSILIVAALSILGTWILAWFGLIAPLREYTYDPILRIGSALSDQSSQVLLVKMDSQDINREGALAETLIKLQSFEPRRIALNFTPKIHHERFYEIAKQHDNITLGRHLSFNQRQQLELEAVPSIADSIPFGVVAYPPNEKGIFRQHKTSYQIEEETYPAFEMACLKNNSEFVKRYQNHESYLIAFQGPVGSLPNVTLDQVLNDELIDVMVNGKIILIGFEDRDGNFWLQTPTTSSQRPMTLSEYQAHALNSLLNQTAIVTVSWMWQWSLLVLLIVASAVLYQSFDSNTMILCTVGLIIVYVILGFLTVHFFHLWVPIQLFIVSQVLLMVLMHYSKLNTVDDSLEEIVHNLSFHAQPYFGPSNLYTDTDFWHSTLQSIDHLLHFKQVIVLEKPRNASFVHTLASLNCTEAQIQERRRDFRRDPYHSAIQSKKPYQVETFFKNAESNEIQYLLPLMYGGEIYGVAALLIDRKTVLDQPGFSNILELCNNQLGELLYEYQIRSSSDNHPSFFSRLFNQEYFHSMIQNVFQLSDLIRQKTTKLHRLCNEFQSSFGVFDLFGRMQYVNSSFVDVLEKFDLTPQKSSALEIITHLSDLQLNQTRKLYRDVVIYRSPVSFTIQRDSKKSYCVVIRPLASEEQTQNGDFTLFGLWGILIEIIDVTEQIQFNQLSGLLSMEMGNKLRNSLSAIQMSAQMMNDPETQAFDKAKMMSAIQTRVDDIVRLLETSEQYLEQDQSIDTLTRFPLNALQALDESIANLEDQKSSRRISFNVEKPQIMNYVYASHTHLCSVFDFLLALLIHDAADESEIVIRVDEQKKHINFYFANQGFGIPKDQFKHYMESQNASRSEATERLQEVKEWVNYWGGTLQVNSDVGIGTRIKLSLESFV